MRALRKIVSTLSDAPFSIPGAARVVRAMRFSLALTLMVWVGAGPFSSFYPEEEATLYVPSGIGTFLPALGPVVFWALKGLVLLGCTGMLWRRTALPGTWLTAVAFAVLNCYVAGFSDLWNYNTHLNAFLIALSFASPEGHGRADPRDASEERSSAIVFFMRTQVAVIYLQAGLAKLLHGGAEWAATTPYLHLVLQGGWAAPWLVQVPRIVTAGGVMVVALELLLPLLLMIRSTQVWAAVVATGLHLGMYSALGISFWHLWVLFPALFFVARRAHVESANESPVFAPIGGSHRTS